MKPPAIVSFEEWQAAHEKVLAKEKEATRARDALAAERRRQPAVQIDKDYVFEGPDGKVRLLDLFDGRRQLVLYHFMFAPGVEGWPSAGCPGCSMFVDNLGDLTHLRARDTSFALVPWSERVFERSRSIPRVMVWPEVQSETHAPGFVTKSE